MSDLSILRFSDSNVYDIYTGGIITKYRILKSDKKCKIVNVTVEFFKLQHCEIFNGSNSIAYITERDIHNYFKVISIGGMQIYKMRKFLINKMNELLLNQEHTLDLEIKGEKASLNCLIESFDEKKNESSYFQNNKNFNDCQGC